ncbi:MAG: alpha/beta hydrolase [Gammaproteobacteria bacterium]|nr:alpha/beta hydrolase [Gammaproteobacteria bacterium]
MSNDVAESVIDNQTITASLSVQNKKPRNKPMTLKLIQLGFRLGGYLSPKIAGRIAYNMWLTPTRFKTPASEQSALESAVIEYHSINSRDIAAFTWGQAETTDKGTILLVHGWSGRGTQLGSFVGPLVDAGYRVISFDAPAHGKSSGKQTNLYEISDTILALQEIYGPFESVITHSFGGPCTALAITHGLKTNRVVTISPPATTLGLVHKFSDALQLNRRTRKNLVDSIANTFGSHIWEELSMMNLIKKIDMPRLIIHDTHDIDVPWEEGQAVAKAWNDAPFISTTGLGHRRILRDDAVIESALAFLNG